DAVTPRSMWGERGRPGWSDGRARSGKAGEIPEALAANDDIGAMAKAAKQSSENNGKALVIVESPAKAKTINKYLGKNYVVKASRGHVRDLPKRKYGIDPGRNFAPDYEILPSHEKIIRELRET